MKIQRALSSFVLVALASCGVADPSASVEELQADIPDSQAVAFGSVPEEVVGLPLPVPEAQLDSYVVPPAEIAAVLATQPAPQEVVPVDEFAPGAATGTMESDLVGGQTELSYNQIGKLAVRNPTGYTWCTATLIRSRVLVTAAHCFGYRTSSATANYGFFVAQHYGYNGSQMMMVDFPAYLVTNFRSFGTAVGAHDIALARLNTAFPSAWATPSPLYGYSVGGPRALEVWGYGCTNRATQAGLFTKRHITYYGPTRTFGKLCQLDSGGPTMAPTSKIGVFLINSGYSSSTGQDVYASVASVSGPLGAQSYAWR